MDLRIGMEAARSAWRRAEREGPDALRGAGHTVAAGEVPQVLAAACGDLGGRATVAVRPVDAGGPEAPHLEIVAAPPGDPAGGRLDVRFTWEVEADQVDGAGVAWAAAVVRTFVALLSPDLESGTGGGGSAGGAHVRPVRFCVGARAAGPEGDGSGRSARLDVAIGPRRSLLAEGILGEIAGHLAGRAEAGAQERVTVRRLSSRWTRLSASGSASEGELGALLAAIAHWWASLEPDELFTLFAGLEALLARRIEEALREGPAASRLTETEFFAHAVEEALGGLWSLRPLLGEEEEAEDELEGWQREVEVALRRRFDSGGDDFARLRVGEPRLTRVEVPAGADWHRPYVLAAGRARLSPVEAPTPAGVPTAVEGRAGEPPAVPAALFDGERTLAEVALRLCVEAPMRWERACRLARSWVRRGEVVPAPAPDYTLPDPELLKAERGAARRLLAEESAAGRSNTLLYFSYGSCMCRLSFRESVPRYELIGAARLPGYRLAFTISSSRRGGGAADIVEDPEGSVWGILYRIPRRYLLRLDEREGVFLGRYQRMQVRVHALGTTFEPVVTYSVVNKAATEIAPSSEYAGLIWDGARGMLDATYCRRLAEQFQAFDVEPVCPV